MVQCSRYLDYQLPDDRKRVRKIMCIIESSDPNLLATTDEIEMDEDLKSNFDEMAAFVLPFDHVASKKIYSHKNDEHNFSETGISSILGGRDQESRIILCFYDTKEHKTLSNKDKTVLCK